MEHAGYSLAKLCHQLSAYEGELLPEDHQFGARLVCPEYSRSAQEIKTYPFFRESRIFALCWDISPDHIIYTTLYPSPVKIRYRRSFVPGMLTQLHTHDYIELAYIAEGEFRQKILGKTIVFRKGELCLIDKNCLHQDYLLNGSAKILFLGIANDTFIEVMDENITTQKIIAFLQSALLKQKYVQQYLHFKPTVSVNCALEDCLYLLLKELYENQIGSDYICKGLLLRIFRILSTEYEFSLSKEQRKTINWIVFEEITDYIAAHYSHITLSDLTEQFHFQEDYFNRLIKDKTGLTYSKYVQQVRLEKACQLLRTSSRSIEEIAEMTGYHNKGYFYKIFQEKYGVTPYKYRKQKKK